MPPKLFGRASAPSPANLSLLDNRQADLEQVDDGYRDTRPIPGAGPVVRMIAAVPVVMGALVVAHLVAAFAPAVWQAAQAALVALASKVGA